MSFNRKEYESKRRKDIKRIAYMKDYLSRNHVNILNKQREYRKENPLKVKLMNQLRLIRTKDLTRDKIQMVYEDNIKKYGTLTCYLCLEPIKFGKDELEHKNPLSRGGTNEYDNLGVSCQICNLRKHKRTEEEYRKEIFI